MNIYSTVLFHYYGIFHLKKKRLNDIARIAKVFHMKDVIWCHNWLRKAHCMLTDLKWNVFDLVLVELIHIRIWYSWDKCTISELSTHFHKLLIYQCLTDVANGSIFGVRANLSQVGGVALYSLSDVISGKNLRPSQVLYGDRQFSMFGSSIEVCSSCLCPKNHHLVVPFKLKLINAMSSHEFFPSKYVMYAIQTVVNSVGSAHKLMTRSLLLHPSGTELLMSNTNHHFRPLINMMS